MNMSPSPSSHQSSFHPTHTHWALLCARVCAWNQDVGSNAVTVLRWSHLGKAEETREQTEDYDTGWQRYQSAYDMCIFVLCALHIISLDHPNNPIPYVSLLFLLYKGGKWGLEALKSQPSGKRQCALKHSAHQILALRQHMRKASIYTASGQGLQGRLPGGEGSAEWWRMRRYYLHRQGRAV